MTILCNLCHINENKYDLVLTTNGTLNFISDLNSMFNQVKRILNKYGYFVCADVTIGNGSVIGAGSIVIKDIPDNVLAYGSPCVVVRELTEDDSIYIKTKRE